MAPLRTISIGKAGAHVEAPRCIVNIRILTEDGGRGREMTHIEILADHAAHLDGAINNRLFDGPAPPEKEREAPEAFDLLQELAAGADDDQELILWTLAEKAGYVVVCGTCDHRNDAAGTAYGACGGCGSALSNARLAGPAERP